MIHSRNVGTMIPGGLAVLECLRSDNITNTVSSEKQSSGNLLLGIASNIRANNRQAHTEAQALKIAQPERNQTAPFVCVR